MKIAIVGMGKLGLKITDNLTGGDHSITVIDKDPEVIDRYTSSLDVMNVVGNGKEISLLKDIGIGDYDYLISTTNRDEKNIVITSLAKRLGVRQVIARISDPEHMGQSQFLKETFGIDHVINPDLSVATEINRYLVKKHTLSNGIYDIERISILEFEATKMAELIGLSDKKVEEKIGNIRVIALSRYGKVIITSRLEDEIIEEGDVIYIIGEKEHIRSLSKRVYEKGKYTDIQHVMIAGGGKTGLYLANMLEEFGASVKIIDNDKERCQYLAMNLNNTLVLHGDATDINFLKEESFGEMDAFVSATGYDEENLLLALMATQEGIEDVIAKISRDNYGDLIENLGVEMALNPIDIEASHIHRILQESTILSSRIIQGQVEIIQVLIDEDMELSDKNILKIRIPKGLLVAAIQRGEEVIIPNAETSLASGDKVVLLGEVSEAFDVEKLLKKKGGLFS